MPGVPQLRLQPASNPAWKEATHDFKFLKGSKRLGDQPTFRLGRVYHDVMSWGLADCADCVGYIIQKTRNCALKLPWNLCHKLGWLSRYRARTLRGHFPPAYSRMPACARCTQLRTPTACISDTTPTFPLRVPGWVVRPHNPPNQPYKGPFYGVIGYNGHGSMSFRLRLGWSECSVAKSPTR